MLVQTYSYYLYWHRDDGFEKFPKLELRRRYVVYTRVCHQRTQVQTSLKMVKKTSFIWKLARALVRPEGITSSVLKVIFCFYPDLVVPRFEVYFHEDALEIPRLQECLNKHQVKMLIKLTKLLSVQDNYLKKLQEPLL